MAVYTSIELHLDKIYFHRSSFSSVDSNDFSKFHVPGQEMRDVCKPRRDPLLPENPKSGVSPLLPPATLAADASLLTQNRKNLKSLCYQSHKPC